MSLSTFNFYAGFSGLQPIDSIFWLGYNLVITTVQMGVTFLLDQDVPMIYAAKTQDRNAKLAELEAKKSGVKTEKNAKEEEQSLHEDIYAEEERKVTFNLAEYYLFSKQKYQLPLVYRTFAWEALAVLAGIVHFYIPFYIYGYGVGNSSGRTEDLFSIYFATY